MNQAVLTTIAITGFGIAFFHAAIPTHWLPFVLTARVQQWSAGKTILITMLAGSGHVAVTGFIGFLITYFGTRLSEDVGRWFAPIAGGILIALGIYYLARQSRGKGHVHFNYPHEHFHESGDHHHHETPVVPKRTSDRAAILSLLAFLIVSPCEGFLPIYVSGIRYGWMGFALLTAILSVATVAGMVVFTSLTLAGLGRVNLGALERHESALIGILLCIVGVLVFIFEH